MRSLYFAILAAVILAAAFFGYTIFQSGTAHRLGKSSRDADPPPPVIKKSVSHGPLLPGQDAVLENYGEDGQLKSRFRAHEYTPRANGQIDVTLPVAEFFMPNHQVMKLSGKTGEMEMPESNSAPQSAGAPMTSGAPSRGRIHDVIIDIFNLFPDSKPDVPDETIVTDNVQFDNQTMLITTESFTDAAGRIVPADEAPVHMTSPFEHRGYAFDGRGMKVRWNDKDGRLEMLEIAHGEQLTIKDASSSGPLGQPGKPARQSPPASSSPASPAPLVSAVPAASAPASMPHPAPRSAKPPAVPVPYLATFSENVRITQGPAMLITGDEMDIDFISRSEQPGPTTAPATRPSTPAAEDKAENPSSASSIPTTQPLVITAVAATQPATQPTTQPAGEPVIIRWTGKLVMLPAQPNRPKLGPGDSIVEVIGRPVTVRRSAPAAQQGDDIRAARLIYRTADGSVTLVNSPSIRHVVLSKVVNGQIDPQTTITTSTLDYKTDATGRKVAILTGPGHAAMPMQDDAAPQAGGATRPAVAMMDTTWQRGAKAYFAGKSQDELEIQHVDLSGDVDVKHPQLAMHSQKLALDFAPALDRPGGKPKAPGQKREQELTRAIAQGTVHCDLTASNGKKQKIDCQNLDVQTARADDGRLYARQVNATGKARARDIDQDLSAETIELTLRPAKPAAKKSDAALAEAPATAPADESATAATELEKLFARDGVRVVNKEGSVATGSRLTVTTEDGSPHVRLIGAPAKVVDVKKNTIQGPLVTVDQGVAYVIGVGEMHMLQESAGGGTPKPMEAHWTQEAVMAGKENRVDIFGAVEVTTWDADGTINVAKGKHIHIDLMDKPAPTTRPATAPAVPATQPAKNNSADSMQLDVGKDKDVRTITIDGNDGDANVLSTLQGSDGGILRQFLLTAPRIIYQMADEKGLPMRTLFVPSAGRMFMGDYRPPEKAKPATPNGADPAGGGRGETAFQWSKQLTYSELQRQAVMTGSVVVDHIPDGKKGDEDRVRIDSDKVTATFEPPTHPTTRPATQPATQPIGGETSLQLKYLTADGNVVVTRLNGATLTADRIEYDPHTHWMTAHGAPSRRAHYQDPDPKRSLNAQDMRWNTDTWKVEMTNARSSNPK